MLPAHGTNNKKNVFQQLSSHVVQDHVLCPIQPQVIESNVGGRLPKIVKKVLQDTFY
eukprot:m.24144 g.24144  ORF g.24144 m.24144 type:complete len:57 (+) comp9627_c0_seq3:997-1167(+)